MIESTEKLGAESGDRRRGRVAILIASITAFVPLVVGMLATGLWTLTYSGTYIAVGAVALFTGTLVFVPGLVALVVYWLRARPGKARTVRTLSVLVAFLGFFPISLACIEITKTCRFKIENRSGVALTNVRLIDPVGTSLRVDDIPPGAVREAKGRPDGEGAVEFQWTTGSETMKGDALGYVTPGLVGQLATITLNADGTVDVVERHDHRSFERRAFPAPP